MGDDGPDSPDLEALDPRPEDKRGSEASLHVANGASAGALGLRNRGVDYWLTTIQKYSTGPPSLFLALHLTNTSLIPLLTRSVPASEPYLLLTRELYQAPVLEDLLLTVPILAHVGSGIALRCLRESRRSRRYGTGSGSRQQKGIAWLWKIPSVQARLGYTLAPLLGIHVLVNRGVPIQVDGGNSSVGLGYVAHGFARAPWLMTGYYVVLVGVGVWHVVGGWAWWTGWKRDEDGHHDHGPTSGANGGHLGSAAGSEAYRRRRRIRWTVSGIAAAGTVLWLAGGLGVVGRGGWGAGWEAKGWEKIYSQVPLLGRYLVSGS